MEAFLCLKDIPKEEGLLRIYLLLSSRIRANVRDRFKLSKETGYKVIPKYGYGAE